MKILIVDDEPLIQIKLEDLLKKNLNGNYKVFRLRIRMRLWKF